jgi:NAD-dependent DNA ligase
MKAYQLVILHGMVRRREQPPSRFIALAGIRELAEQKAKTLQNQANAFRELSSSLGIDNA